MGSSEGEGLWQGQELRDGGSSGAGAGDVSKRAVTREGFAARRSAGVGSRGGRGRGGVASAGRAPWGVVAWGRGLGRSSETRGRAAGGWDSGILRGSGSLGGWGPEFFSLPPSCRQ